MKLLPVESGSYGPRLICSHLILFTFSPSVMHFLPTSVVSVVEKTPLILQAMLFPIFPASSLKYICMSVHDGGHVYVVFSEGCGFERTPLGVRRVFYWS